MRTEFLGDCTEFLMKGLFGFLLAATVVAATGSSMAQTQIDDAVEVAAEIAADQASIDLAVAPLRSMKDVRSHLRSTPNSPLFALPPVLRKQFIESLVFTGHGLGSYSFVPLSKGLSVSDAYKLLALFGAQSSIAFIPGLPRPANDLEVRILQSSQLSPMATAPPWLHGICVIHGKDGDCKEEYGRNCSRACDR